jgi:hypothetical protein
LVSVKPDDDTTMLCWRRCNDKFILIIWNRLR